MMACRGLFGLVVTGVVTCSTVVSGTPDTQRQPPARQGTTTADIVRQAAPATVAISGVDSNGDGTSGAGFIVDSSGTIVTNLHVINGLRSLAVRLRNGDVFDRVVVRAYDETKDIAILQVPGFSLPTVALGNSDDVEQGDSVVVIGNPVGLEGTVSAGLVSAIRLLEGYRVFQTDAAASPGSSGGPMLDESGSVVGILTFRVRGGENLNFVIPINYARGLLGVNDALSLAELDRRLTPQPVAIPPQRSVTQPSMPGATGVPTARRTVRRFRFLRLNDRFAVADAGPAIDLLRRLTAGAAGAPQQWAVDHDHSENFSGFCRGTLLVLPGRLVFRSQNASESFDVPLDGIAEIGQLPRFGAFVIDIYR